MDEKTEKHVNEYFRDLRPKSLDKKKKTLEDLQLENSYLQEELYRLNEIERLRNGGW